MEQPLKNLCGNGNAFKNAPQNWKLWAIVYFIILLPSGHKFLHCGQYKNRWSSGPLPHYNGSVMGNGGYWLVCFHLMFVCYRLRIFWHHQPTTTIISSNVLGRTKQTHHGMTPLLPAFSLCWHSQGYQGLFLLFDWWIGESCWMGAVGRFFRHFGWFALFVVPATVSDYLFPIPLVINSLYCLSHHVLKPLSFIRCTVSWQPSFNRFKRKWI